jgi:hypothetical protein
MTSGFDQLERELRSAAARQDARRSAPALWPGRRALSVAALTVGVLVTVAIAVGAVVLLHGSKRAGRQVGAVSTERYTDSAGWSLSYPRAMQLERSSSGPGLATFSEVTIASFSEQRAVHTGRTRDGGYVGVRPPLDRDGTFPANGVAFRMLLVQGGLGPEIFVPDTRFPLKLSSFGAPQSTEFPKADYRKDGVPAARSLTIQADGQQITASVLIGHDASSQLRATITQIIASVAFPRLHAGTEAGGLTVLGSGKRYRVGSFTLIHARSAICTEGANRCHAGTAPFYLVHAPGRLHQPDLIQPCPTAGSCTPPGAFYAIGWKDESILGSYTARCDLQLDRHDDQFYCTNMDARWDRVGRVITRPPGARINAPLQFAFAKIAWDGHVVLASGSIENPPRAPALRTLWPKWNQSAG